MKKFITLIILLLSLNVIAQNTKKELNEIATKMFVDMNNRDFDAIIDMTYPKVFELASKDQMKALFKSFFEGNSEFSVEIPHIEPKFKVSEVFNKESDSISYAFISYDLRMKMTFKNQEFEEEQQKMMISMMSAKGMDVKFITKNTLDMNMLDRITVLIKDNYTNNKWAMLNYDPDSPLFYQMTPSVLIEAGKKYKQDLMLERKKNEEK